MTPDEMIECGHLLEKLGAGIITNEEMVRLTELKRRAKAELPTDETEIARALRVDVEWQQRWADLGAFLERAGKEVAEAAVKVLVEQLPTLLSKGLPK